MSILSEVWVMGGAEVRYSLLCKFVGGGDVIARELREVQTALGRGVGGAKVPQAMCIAWLIRQAAERARRSPDW